MDGFDLVLRGGWLVLPWGIEQADVGVRAGRIAAMGDLGQVPAAATLECRNLHVLPGLIDPHVHLRDPGDPAVETIPDGTRAAVLGGIATVFDMPNTAEPITDTARLDRKRAGLAGRAWCDVGLYVAATKANIPGLAALEQQPGVCAIKVFTGSARGEMLVEDDASLEALMRSGRRRVCYHAEDHFRLTERRALFEVGDPPARHMDWHDVECAFLGTRRVVALARATGRPAHIVHVSTAEELDYLAEHRDIASVEVLVNHLSQVGPEAYEKLGGYAVMSPPIRERRHLDAAWAAVRDGRVDCIGSDHAPHSRAAKERPWPETASGLTGVQTLLPVMLDHVAAGKLSLTHLAELMSAGPARVYWALRKGRLAVGYDADFTVVDTRHRRTIEESWIASPCGWTPFAGHRCTGWPKATVVRGNVVMREDEVLGTPVGAAVAFR
ncbi:dihydroorotase [Rhodovastum atsumiense]|nr:dihydroorotase [Rhodovastum atsumiense]